MAMTYSTGTQNPPALAACWVSRIGSNASITICFLRPLLAYYSGMLTPLVAIALSLWAVWFPVSIQTQFHQPTQDIDAQGMAWSATFPDGSCLISVHPHDFTALTPELQSYVILHEVGHCLGLGHFGDCDSEPTIMASCVVIEPTERDRIELIRLHGHRTVVPMVGH